MVRCSFGDCDIKIRSGQRGFNGLCSRHKRMLARPSRTKGPIGCVFCTKPKFKVICARCAKDYDRWQRSPQNTGTHWSLMEWVARRVRRYARLSEPAAQQKTANRNSAAPFRSRSDDALKLPA